MDLDFNALLNTVAVLVLGAIAHWIRKFIARTDERVGGWDDAAVRVKDVAEKMDRHLADHARDSRQLDRIEGKVDHVIE